MSPSSPTRTDRFLQENGGGSAIRITPQLLVRIQRDERAQDLVEYALLAAFIAVSSGALLPPVASSISVILSKMVSVVNTAAVQ